jgi:uncharacterized protein
MEHDYGSELSDQTKVWTGRINTEMKGIKLARKDRKEFLENINAYIKDSAHFEQKGDLVRAFEAIVWAWSWLEIGINEGILEKKG